MEKLINDLQLFIYGRIMFYRQANGLWYSREENKYINSNRVYEILSDEINYMRLGD